MKWSSTGTQLWFSPGSTRFAPRPKCQLQQSTEVHFAPISSSKLILQKRIRPNIQIWVEIVSSWFQSVSSGFRQTAPLGPRANKLLCCSFWLGCQAWTLDIKTGLYSAALRFEPLARFSDLGFFFLLSSGSALHSVLLPSLLDLLDLLELTLFWSDDAAVTLMFLRCSGRVQCSTLLEETMSIQRSQRTWTWLCNYSA